MKRPCEVPKQGHSCFCDKMGSAIGVHPLTNDSDAAWAELKQHQTVEPVTPLSLDTPVQPDALRFVCISDTHTFTSRMRHPIPPGDVLVHAGDFTRRGLISEIDEFNYFLGGFLALLR